MEFVLLKNNGHLISSQQHTSAVLAPFCPGSRMEIKPFTMDGLGYRERKNLAAYLGIPLRQVMVRIEQGGIGTVTLPSGEKRIVLTNRRQG